MRGNYYAFRGYWALKEVIDNNNNIKEIRIVTGSTPEAEQASR